MPFVQNVPFFCIMLSMFGGIISSVLPPKYAKYLSVGIVTAISGLSLWLIGYFTTGNVDSFTYMMGHFPAPWGNELRAGVLEAVMALFVSVIMLLSVLAGRKKLAFEIHISRHSIYCTLCCFLLSSLMDLA